MLSLRTLLVATAASAAAVGAHSDNNNKYTNQSAAAYLDGYGPLDGDLELPYAFHHLGSLGSRVPFKKQTKVEWRRSHARDVHPQAEVRSSDIKEHLSPHDIYPPKGCQVKKLVTLQRHGARYMPATGFGSSELAQKSLDKFHKALANVSDDQLNDPRLGILRNLTTPSGNGDLVPYGALQAYYSGVYDREVYGHLAEEKPFVRASGNYGNQSQVPSDRVLWTARWWALGFDGQPFPNYILDSADKVRDSSLPELNVVLSEEKGFNNTMQPSTCPALSHDTTSDKISAEYENNTVFALTGKRLQHRLEPAVIPDLTGLDITNLMSACSYNSLLPANATSDAKLEFSISPVCDLFNHKEWERYNYQSSLDFYYYMGIGNVGAKGGYQGYVRELYARLNGSSSVPTTPALTLNTTLLSEGGLPLGKDAPKVYGDFTHDADISAIQLVLGLYDGAPLEGTPNAQLNSTTPFDAARSVPYQTKTAFESITCGEKEEQYVRIRVNQVPYPAKSQPWCPLTQEEKKATPSHFLREGLCPLSAALRNLEWANGEGLWDTCFANVTTSS